MVRIKTTTKDGRDYYSLVHTVRNGKHTNTRTKYIGREIPRNIDTMIEDFRHELYIEDYGKQLEIIKQTHIQTLKTTPPSMVQKHYDAFAVRFTYDSNRIEGSTLTYRETAQLLLENQSPSRPLDDVLEAKSHQKLFEEMRRYVATGSDLRRGIFLEWHRILFRDSKPDIAGKIRDKQVQIIGSTLELPLPYEILPMISEFFLWYNEEKDRLHPVELAALVHYKLVSIHPFGDGNGRMSRMFMNFILHIHKYPMYNFLNKERKQYYNALSRSDKNNDPYIFVRYLTRRYVQH